ncbi:MAG: PAS domain-containing protein [bacterium]|nr:PAS domain-containing protein [bacterium]
MRWLIGLRLIVISTLFLGTLIIQTTSRQILPLSSLYSLFLLTYGLSLLYLTLHLRGVSTRIQAIAQLVGDLLIVTGFVYATGGSYSPFSFLYLTVIVVAAALLRGGGLVFAGLSALSYGVLVDLIVFEVIPIPPNLTGVQIPDLSSRVLIQLMIHVVGFVLVAFLVSTLTESLRSAQQRLEEETARATQFAALTDHVVRSVGAGIMACDLDGNLLHLNPAGAKILEIEDPDDHVGTPIEELMPLDNNNWGLIWARAHDRSIVRVEESIGGPSKGVGMSVGPLEDEIGRVVGFVVNFKDLSAIEMETARSRLRDRMAAVGEMAARMAHEIKNPLASISGSCQVLSSTAGLNETGQRLVGIVVDESIRLSSILDSFLDYARHPEVHKISCDASQMLRDSLDLLKRSPEVREAHRFQLQAPDQLEMLGDPDLLRQVFWNLSRNSIQAMPEGGSLKIDCRLTGEWIELRWKDTGIGMTDEIQNRAFEPFFTASEKGTGLGLAVVYTAVHEHGGTINIESELGQGTTVTIQLPAPRTIDG